MVLKSKQKSDGKYGLDFALALAFGYGCVWAGEVVLVSKYWFIFHNIMSWNIQLLYKTGLEGGLAMNIL